MTIYIVTIILIIIFQPFLQLIFGSEKYKNIYVFIIGAWLFFILALRSETVGSDLPTYINRYPVFGEAPWKELPKVSEKLDMEIGYAVLSKLLYLFSANPRVLICAVSFFIIYAFSKEIKDNSKNPAFSYLLYITLGMYARAFTAYRQQIATALALLSYRYIRDKKPIKFFIIILIAATIHKSVLFVLPMYFIANMKINCKVYICSFIGCILCVTIGDRLLSYITYKDRYTEMVARGSDGAVGSCIIFGAFIVLMIIVWKRFRTFEAKFYMHFAIFCLLISSLTFVLPIIARMLYYFDAVMLYAIPNTVSQIRNISTRYFIICSICFITLFYYICIICQADTGSIIPFSFYWT